MKKITLVFIFAFCLFSIDSFAQKAADKVTKPVKSGERVKTCTKRAYDVYREVLKEGGSRGNASEKADNALRACIRYASTEEK